jgi:peptide/nickel transport system ATP-binding protein
MLDVANLTVQVPGASGAVNVVDNISFSINAGETFCLVGESGSGKSMTALAIMGLLPASLREHCQGSVKLTAESVADANLLALNETALTALRGSRIAMVFQEPMTCLNPVMTVGDQLVEALHLSTSKLGEPELDDEGAVRRAVGALGDVHIDNPEARFREYPHRLSGGQRQRVMLAMALLCEPDLLIADEPTTALDVTVQAQILQLIAELQKRRNMGVLFITHDLGVVAQIADTVAVMRQGRLVETGPVDTVLGQPIHEYTRHLLNCVPERMAAERARASAPDSVGVTPMRESGPGTTLWTTPGSTTAPTSEARSGATSDSKVAQPVLELENVEVHFPVRRGLMRRVVDHIRAVDGVNLTIPERQIAALVGESGCGKTTLGRAITRLIQPTAGRIKFEGVDISDLGASELRPVRRRLQIVFQDPIASLNPRLTVATALCEPMAVHGIGSSADDRLERAARTLEEVQLEREHLWRYPHEFSGGQRQRIGIARALVLEPTCIVCDEVTSALDVSVQAELLRLLLDLRDQRGLSLLLITHDIGVVEFVSDYTMVMNAGKIVERGATDEVCNRPNHAYTQQLLSAVPRMRGFTTAQ